MLEDWHAREIEPDLREKHSPMWRVYGSKANVCSNPSAHPEVCAGNVLLLVKRKRFATRDSENATVEKIWPAVEPTIEYLVPELRKLDYQAFGFSHRNQDGRELVCLPDCDALNHNVQHSDLPYKPVYVSAEGIASDLDFIQMNQLYDGVVSSGREFYHDMSVHVASPLFCAKRFGTKYAVLRGAFRKVVQALLGQIALLDEAHAEQLTKILALRVDGHQAHLGINLRQSRSSMETIMREAADFLTPLGRQNTLDDFDNRYRYWRSFYPLLSETEEQGILRLWRETVDKAFKRVCTDLSTIDDIVKEFNKDF